MQPRRILLLPFLLLTLASCAVNPLRTAQTLEQRGDALYGAYVIAKEQGAALLNDATVPDSAKRPLAEAMVGSSSTASSLQDALIKYSQVKAQLSAGATSAEKLAIAERNLAAWLAMAQPAIEKLVRVVGGLAK